MVSEEVTGLTPLATHPPIMRTHHSSKWTRKINRSETLRKVGLATLNFRKI